MIAAIYARKSTDQSAVTDEQKSVARQVEHGRQFAARKGWAVADDHIYVDDGISGAEFAKRPGLLRLMNALKRPAFQVLIVSELSRIGREQLEVGFVVKQISQAGVKLFAYLDDKELLCESALDKVMMSLTSFAADMEREKARQRAIDTAQRKAKAGHVTGGSCFGYVNMDVTGPDGRRSHVRREIEPDQAAVVRRIFTLAADGCGFRAIAKQLNDEGAPAPRAQLGRSHSWTPSTVREVLYRTTYRGEITWNASRKRDGWGQQHQVARPESEWIRVPAPDLRIVSDDLWQRAHARIGASRTLYLKATNGQAFGRPPVGNPSKYLLTNLATCGVCGGPMQVRSRKASEARAFFYGCSYYYYRGRAVCPNHQDVPMPDADGVLLEALLDDVLTSDVVADSIDAALELVMGDAAPNPSERLEAELARVAQERDRLVAAVAAGGSLAGLLSALQAREREHARLTSELAAIVVQAKPRPADAAKVRRDLIGLADGWRRVLSRDPENARPIVSKLLVGRAVFTPAAESNHWTLSGRATLSGLFQADIFSVAMASPPGFEPGSRP